MKRIATLSLAVGIAAGVLCLGINSPAEARYHYWRHYAVVNPYNPYVGMAPVYTSSYPVAVPFARHIGWRRGW